MKTFITIAAVATVAAACGSSARQGAAPQLTSANGAVGWPTLGQGSARFIRIDLGPDTFAECQRLAPKFPLPSRRA